MNMKRRNLLAVAGVCSSVLGIFLAIPSFIQERYGAAIGSAILVMGGIVLLAIAFGEE